MTITSVDIFILSCLKDRFVEYLEKSLFTVSDNSGNIVWMTLKALEYFS